jgi:hypothetical protein
MTRNTLKSKIRSLQPEHPVTTEWQEQKEQWLRWLDGYDGKGYYKRKKCNRPASFIYNNLKSPAMALWLGEAAGIPKVKVLEAKKAAGAAKPNRAMQCAAIRRVIPWKMIESGLNSSPKEDNSWATTRSPKTGRDFLVLWKWDEAERVQGLGITRAEGTHAAGLQRGDRMFIWATANDELFLLGAIRVERSGTKWAEGKSLNGAFQIIPLEELKWKLRFQQSASDRLSREGSLAWQVRARRRPTPETVKLLEQRLSEGAKQVQRADRQAKDRAASAQEQSAGFQSNPAIRRAVEAYSMKMALALLNSKGYKNITDTSLSNPYDYTCEKDGQEFFIEVKGTQTAGNTIMLTRNEVENVRKNPKSCVLILVHSVTVSGKNLIKVSGGTTEVREDWKLRPEELKPTQYVWKVT